jgi:nitroreductase
VAIRTEKKLSDVVRERRATPSFSPSPVHDEDLKKIIRAGLQAPSGYNMQPWRFVVVRDPEQRKRLRTAAMNQPKVEQAPVVIVACGDIQGWKDDLEEVMRVSREHGLANEAQLDTTRRKISAALGSHSEISMWVTKQTIIAATTMMWMAESLGYDTAPMEGFHEDQVRQVLGIPPHVRVIFLLPIGHLAGEDKKYAGRLPSSRMVFAERFGEPFVLD